MHFSSFLMLSKCLHKSETTGTVGLLLMSGRRFQGKFVWFILMSDGFQKMLWPLAKNISDNFMLFIWWK